MMANPHRLSNASKRSRSNADATGRSKRDTRHVRHYEYMLASAAYRSLSLRARCLLTELKRLYRGDNNGELFLSIRRAGELLGGSAKDTTTKAFRELQERGFIRSRVKSGFTWKNGQATSWILTEFEFAGQPATKNFMRWRPPQNSFHGTPGGYAPYPPQVHRTRGRYAFDPDRTGGRDASAPITPKSVPATGTQIVYQEGDAPQRKAGA